MVQPCNICNLAGVAPLAENINGQQQYLPGSSLVCKRVTTQLAIINAVKRSTWLSQTHRPIISASSTCYCIACQIEGRYVRTNTKKTVAMVSQRCMHLREPRRAVRFTHVLPLTLIDLCPPHLASLCQATLLPLATSYRVPRMDPCSEFPSEHMQLS